MDTRAFPCKSCGDNIIAEIPKFDVINRPTVSILVAAHGEALRCKKCGQTYQFMITGIPDVKFGFKIIDAESQNEAITPPKRGPVNERRVARPGNEAVSGARGDSASDVSESSGSVATERTQD